MSITIMPPLPLSMAKGLHKAPVFNTVVQPTAAKRVSSVSLTPYPTWAFEFDLDAITGNEGAATSTIASFLGTLMVCQGRATTFLFTDPQDSTVSYSTSGMLNVTAGAANPMSSTGDGTSKNFQLARSIGGVSWDILQNVSVGSLKVSGVPQSLGVNYTISSLGVITFGTAPANNAVLTWAGSFQFLCRFTEDTVDAVRIFTVNSGTDLWNISGIKFESEFS
jgi:hypothetical protein